MVRMIRSRWSVLAALPLVLMLAGRPFEKAGASSFTVTKYTDSNDGACNSDCSLREAIIAANANSGDDTITLAAGTYTLSLGGAGEDAAATGDLDIRDDLTITGAGPSATYVSANYLDRVFDVIVGQLSLSNLNVQYGDTSGNGAGIRCQNAGVTLDRVHIIQNFSTADGGGIFASNCPLSIEDSAVALNSGISGGGIAATAGSTVTFVHSMLSVNEASWKGGGLWASGSDASFVDSLFEQNLANDGVSNGYGGGIYFDSPSGTLTVTGSVFLFNFARQEGGAAYLYRGTSASFENTTIGENSTNGYGGGLNVHIPTTIRLSTIVKNVADEDGNSPHGGGGLLTFGTGFTVTLTDTILANNVDHSASPNPDCWKGDGTITSLGYNLVKTVSDCTFAATGDITGVDPQLDNLYYHEFASSYAPLAGSPVINAGDPAITGLPTYDQRGSPFLRALGRVDIGAVEYQLQMFLPVILRQ